VRPEGLGKLINIIHHIWSRTRDFPTCYIVPVNNNCSYRLLFVPCNGRQAEIFRSFFSKWIKKTLLLNRIVERPMI
jgi:hypothetical protein